MKKVLAVLLAVIAICSASRADNILIYRGIQSDRQNDASLKRYGYYYIFDISSGQYTSVQFGPLGALATAGNKYYSASGTSEFFYDFPATEKGARTQTDFIYSLTTTSTSTPNTTVTFGDFKGHNTDHSDLGGTFTGSYPNGLTLIARDASGNGDVPTDNVQLISGVFYIAINLTRESNSGNTNSGDTLSQAVTVVTDELTKAGYRQESD